MEENKKKKRKKIVLPIIIAIVVIVIASVVIYFLKDSDKEIIPNLVVSSMGQNSENIRLESRFDIVSDVDTTVEYISKNITIEPNIEYDINMKNPLEYEIVPKANLNSNSIYNVVYKSKQGKYKWSFQTEKIYAVSSTYPINEALNVDTSTVIEYIFSYTPNEDIEKYFEITPHVDGKFEYDERKVRFIPKEKLKAGAKYTVTIKKGFGNKENEDYLKEDRTSIFYTMHNNYDQDLLMVENMFSFKKGDNIQIPVLASYFREVSDVKVQIYKYNNENDFVTAVTDQMQSMSYQSLVEISTRGLTKIYDAKYLSYELADGVNGYDKVINIDAVLEEGYYLVTIQENDVTYYTSIQINDIMGYVSYFDDKCIVWVNDSSINSVIPNASIYRNGEYIGITNSKGYIEKDNFERQVGNYNTEYIKVEVENKLPLYMFFTDWYSNDSQMLNNDQNLNIYTFTDREKYRQGEKVNLWGFIKHRDNIEFDNVSIDLCYSDYSSILETKNIEVDDFGTFSADFDLSGFDNGYYYFRVYANGHIVGYKYFEIRDYTTKNYNVDAKLDKEIVYAGEELQLDVAVTLFDGTPITNTEFKYSYFYGDNEKIGKFVTDLNGIATVKLDTTYITKYSMPVYANVQIWNDGKEAEYETKYLQFVLLPKKENYNLTCYYDKQTNTYNFEAKTYFYDKSNEEYIGTYTDRNINIQIDKYQTKQVLDYTYYNESTKKTEEVYKTVKEYIGAESLLLPTQNGIGRIVYKNPIPNDIEGYITYTSKMAMEDDKVITDTSYTYIDGLYDYSSGVEYTIDYDYNKRYKVGDMVKVKVLKNGKNINTPIHILHIIKSAKGTETVYTPDVEYSFEFMQDYGTDIIVKTYVFDGTGIYSANYYEGYQSYSLDKSEIKLDIQINFDKSAYKPGEEAAIEITTKYKGKPISASVNVCSVDNSYLAYYANNSDIISSLYNYYYFSNNNDHISHQIWGIFVGGEGGGGEEERSKFDTTAFFENVITDENGKASLKIKWPDNITTWSVLTQGVSKEYIAGQSLKEVSVTLPYFVTPIFEDVYLVNEQPSINIRSNGINVKNGDTVEYTITLTDPNGNSKKDNITSKIGEYANYELPSLFAGTYSIKIYGKCNEYTDTVIHKFDVEESKLVTNQLVDIELNKDDTIKIYNNIAKIYLFNSSTNNIVDELFELSNLPNIRNDQIVISNIANEILKNLTGGKYEKSTENVFFAEEGIELMKNAPKDVMLTAKILSTGYPNIYIPSMIDFLNGYIEDENVDIREKMFAYWGLASLKQPILADLNNIKKNIKSDDLFEQALLGLAYADIGDFDNAKQILNDILLPNLDISKVEIYEYTVMLAIKLNYEDIETIYADYLNLNRESEYTNFVKLFYVQNEVLNNVKNASVILNINGESKEFDLEKIGIEIVEIKQTDNVVVEGIDKNVFAKIEKYTEVDKTNTNGILSKEYLVNGKKTNNFNNGDIVKTRIYIDYTKLDKDISYFMIEDIMPNCMVYLQDNGYGEYNNKVIKTPSDMNENKLTFVVSLYNNSEPYIEYETRVISAGKYISDGTILKTHNNSILDYVSAGNIDVK